MLRAEMQKVGLMTMQQQIVYGLAAGSGYPCKQPQSFHKHMTLRRARLFLRCAACRTQKHVLARVSSLKILWIRLVS